MADTTATLDHLALVVVHNLPQALLVVLTTLVIVLVGKDIINGMMRSPFLNPNTWQPLTLVDVKQLSHNVRRFRFALPHQEQLLGLPLGQHVSIKGSSKNGGGEVFRCTVVLALAARCRCPHALLPAHLRGNYVRLPAPCLRAL